jgi:hypothetical protein
MLQSLVRRHARRIAPRVDGLACAHFNRRRRRWYGALLSTMVLIASVCGTASGDDDDKTPDYIEGPGIMGRIDHIEGTGIPQIFPITPVQLFPFYVVDQSLFFSDLRVFPTNYGQVGGNAGIGYRYYSESLDRVFGISGWYDGDNTRSVLLQQLGLSVETYADPFDIRSNFYLPVGPLTRQSGLSLVPGTVQFQGDNLVYDQLRSYIVAMKGLDAEIGTLLPGEFLRDHGVRVYGGGYHFSDDQGDRITGASARLVANFVRGLDAQMQVTYDNFFRTRVFVGVSYTFGALHRSEMKQNTAYGRIGEHVTRNFTVVAEGHNQVERKTAIDPSTGSPYTFAHVVSSAAPGGDGSINNPFNTISAAQLAGREIVFVHAGSSFTGPNASIVLNPGDRLFGDGGGVQHFIQVPELGALLLPQGAGNLPVLSGSVGDSVVLANNTIFSGFSINGAGGNAIVGNALQNVTLSNVAIGTPTLDGLQLNNTAGSVSITNIGIANSGGSGINLQGGTGAIQFLGSTNVSGAGGPAVLIQNLASAGYVSFAGLGIDHRQNVGLQILGSAGTVNVSGTAGISNESGSTAAALDIENSSGSFNFSTVNVTGAKTSAATGAVNLQNDTGTTSFSTLNIGSQSGTALLASSAGTLNVNPATNNVANLSQGGVITAANGAAVDIQNTILNANFNSISSNNAPVAAISLQNTTGLFSVFGNGSGAAGSGGLIQNAPTAILLQNAGTVGFGYMTLDHDGVGIKAVNVANLAFANSSLTNTTTGLGMDLTNVQSLLVTNSTFSGNAGANIQAQFSQLGTYAYTFTGNTFTSATADNIDLTSLAGGQGSTMNLFFQGNSLTNSHVGSDGLNLGWNGTLSAKIDSSTFVASGGTNTGVFITNAATTGLSNVAYTNNAFGSTGGTDTALNIALSGPGQVTVFNNLAQFNAANGTAFQMSLAPSAIVNITSNTVNDTVGGATGILFSSIAGPGVVTIDDNSMNMTTLGIDRGIIFSSVTGTIQLIGTQNNSIINANTPFFAPVGTTTGAIIVNQAFVP